MYRWVFLLLVFMLGIVYFTRTVKKPVALNGSAMKSAPASRTPEILIKNLDTPWDLCFLPDGEMIISERSGKLLRVGKGNGKTTEIKGVAAVGEGGLLGIALHPHFSSNHYIYLYLTTENNSQLTNIVERFSLSNDQLTDGKTLLSDIRASTFHDGGRMEFGPDGYLYIGTGDAQQDSLAQDKNSLNGKILRIRDDGTIPSDNPFGNAVYSYGHRNVQGMAWDSTNTMWATEHGRSFPLSGLDELNRIVKGGNYGWPVVEGDETREGMTAPVINSGPDTTWAPSGMTYLKGFLYFAGLKGESLYRAQVRSGQVISFSAFFATRFGRLRTVRVGPDGMLYILTSNRDGRGSPSNDDDRLIRVNPLSLPVK